MIYWLLQFADLIYYNIFHLFFAFGLFCWFVWTLRIFLSTRYKPFKTAEPFRPSVSILVPIYNEKTDILLESLGTMIKNTGADDEILALVDVRDKAATMPGAIFRHPRLHIVIAPPGKRQALSAGFQYAINPIVIVTGSDTQFDNNTVDEIVKPFIDPKIGGVTGQVVTTNDNGIGGKCYQWSLVLRNRMIYPAMSTSGTVHVLNGECYAMRKELALVCEEEFLNQTFMGKKCDSGDDGWMTTLIIKKDFKTVYQSTAIAYTNPPTSFREFLRQQTRWNRNSTRRSLTALSNGFAYKHGPLYPFQLFISLVRLPFWIVVIGYAGWRFFFGHDIGVVATSWFDPWWHMFRPLIFIAGVIIIRALRGLPYLVREPKALLFLPAYAFISPFILAPYKLYAMLTARDTKWLTRGKKEEEIAERRPSLAYATAMAAVILVVISMPLLALTVAIAEDDADSY